MAFSTCDSKKWKDIFFRVSSGRFDGPGDRQCDGGPVLDADKLDIDQWVAEGFSKRECVCTSVDGWADVNAECVYNVIACAPCSFFLAVRRVDAASALNLIVSLKTVIPTFRTSPTHAADNGCGPLSRSTRLQEVTGKYLWAMCTENASGMEATRQMAQDKSLVLLAFECFAHTTNLIGIEFCHVSRFKLALRDVVEAVDYFRRSTRAREALQADCVTNEAASQCVGQLVTFCETRWVG